MEKNKVVSTNNKSKTDGYKIIEVNMYDTTESLYAVCTPVKK